MVRSQEDITDLGRIAWLIVAIRVINRSINVRRDTAMDVFLGNLSSAVKRIRRWSAGLFASLLLVPLLLVSSHVGYAAGPADESATKAMEQWGWSPMAGSIPPFACKDDSYDRAV